MAPSVGMNGSIQIPVDVCRAPERLHPLLVPLRRDSAHLDPEKAESEARHAVLSSPLSESHRHTHCESTRIGGVECVRAGDEAAHPNRRFESTRRRVVCDSELHA